MHNDKLNPQLNPLIVQKTAVLTLTKLGRGSNILRGVAVSLNFTFFLHHFKRKAKTSRQILKPAIQICGAL